MQSTCRLTDLIEPPHYLLLITISSEILCPFLFLSLFEINKRENCAKKWFKRSNKVLVNWQTVQTVRLLLQLILQLSSTQCMWSRPGSVHRSHPGRPGKHWGVGVPLPLHSGLLPFQFNITWGPAYVEWEACGGWVSLRVRSVDVVYLP